MKPCETGAGPWPRCRFCGAAWVVWSQSTFTQKAAEYVSQGAKVSIPAPRTSISKRNRIWVAVVSAPITFVAVSFWIVFTGTQVSNISAFACIQLMPLLLTPIVSASVLEMVLVVFAIDVKLNLICWIPEDQVILARHATGPVVMSRTILICPGIGVSVFASPALWPWIILVTADPVFWVRVGVPEDPAAGAFVLASAPAPISVPSLWAFWPIPFVAPCLSVKLCVKLCLNLCQGGSGASRANLSRGNRGGH